MILKMKAAKTIKYNLLVKGSFVLFPVGLFMNLNDNYYRLEKNWITPFGSIVTCV